MGDSGRDGGPPEKLKKFAPLNRQPEIAKAARHQMRVATQSANAEILDKMREIVRVQLNHLQNQVYRNEFTAQDAGQLQRLAQTYAILDNRTEKEQASYDFSDMSAEQAESLRLEAEKWLAK